MTQLTLDRLTDALRGGVVAFRSVSRLTPAGGPSDKVFPPSYAVDDRAATKYAMERRRVDGQEVETVLLDSVASQANRMELALLEAHASGALQMPMLYVDFSGQEGLEDLGRITALEAPHRIADALFRDSELEGQPFRMSSVGRAFTEARPAAATAVYRDCPTALVFGVWDSTGPKGGMGAKYPRALVSEIVGVGVERGVKTASRLDPAQISIVPIYASKDDSWTADPEQAQVDSKGKPIPYGSSKQSKGKPSEINHGNVAPSIEAKAGGATIDYAQQTTVLSLPALRRLRFVTGADDQPLAAEGRRAAELAARTALAALGLAAIALQRVEGYDLRSRCLLVPEGPLCIEALGSEGGAPEVFALDADSAVALVHAAAAQAEAAGMGWRREAVALKPAARLSDLIRRSRAKEAAGQAEEQE